MKYLYFVFGISLIAVVCSNCDNLSATSDTKSYRHVGDITFDPAVDDPDFKVCYPDKIFQYFNNGSGPEYLDEKIEMDEYFLEHYESIELFEESGMIRIRFVVNCEGKADRFRMISSDMDYQEKVFDKKISSQLINLTKSIADWPQKKYNKGDGDYYMYLIFKIKNGQLIEVMP